MEEKLDLPRQRTKKGMNTVWFETWTHFHLVTESVLIGILPRWTAATKQRVTPGKLYQMWKKTELSQTLSSLMFHKYGQTHTYPHASNTHTCTWFCHGTMQVPPRHKGRSKIRHVSDVANLLRPGSHGQVVTLNRTTWCSSSAVANFLDSTWIPHLYPFVVFVACRDATTFYLSLQTPLHCVPT